MKRLACVGGFIFASFLGSAFAAAQIPSPENVYVLQASSRQATTTTPLTLTCSEPFQQGTRTVLRQTAVAIPAGDVIDLLTTRVRSQKFANVSTGEFLFVLDVRSKSVSARASDPVVLGLASGAVVAVPPSCVHAAATTWLRGNLSAPKAAASELAKPDPGLRRVLGAHTDRRSTCSGDLLANVSTNDCDGSIRGVMPELRLGAPKYPASVDKMSGGIEIPPLC
jgi:hypothetical protein